MCEEYLPALVGGLRDLGGGGLDGKGRSASTERDSVPLLESVEHRLCKIEFEAPKFISLNLLLTS